MKKTCLLSLFLTTTSPGFAQQGLDPKPTIVPDRPPWVWDIMAAAHLMRRAGFSAPPRELERLVSLGFSATLDDLLNFETVDDSEMEDGLADREFKLTRIDPIDGRTRAHPAEMNRWWLYRMIHSKRQLLEKMTLFWHDHFATSVRRIDHVHGGVGKPLMLKQNRLIRQHALGNFKILVHELARDPAMLIWLDNFVNFPESPNENWARELMELFTMGVDQYSEVDVQEAARAFTGWTLESDSFRNGFYQFHYDWYRHDFGRKSFLGVEGHFDGDDIINIIFARKTTAEFIARKLWEFFVYPNPSEALVRELGRLFRENGYEIRPLINALFRHPDSFSERAVRSQVKSPVEVVCGFMREMELPEHGLLPSHLARMNQLLFAPPDVGGWVGGPSWINTSLLLARYNFVRDYTALAREPGYEFLNFPRIIEENDLATAGDFVEHFVNRFVQGDVSSDTRRVLEDYLIRGDDGSIVDFQLDRETVDKKVRGLIHLITLLPVYQLN